MRAIINLRRKYRITGNENGKSGRGFIEEIEKAVTLVML
jgi:hypothetical protein